MTHQLNSALPAYRVENHGSAQMGAEVREDPGRGHSRGEVPGENGGRVLQERTQQRPGGEQRVAGAGAGDTKGWGGDTRPGLHCLTRPTLGRE